MNLNGLECLRGVEPQVGDVLVLNVRSYGKTSKVQGSIYSKTDLGFQVTTDDFTFWLREGQLHTNHGISKFYTWDGSVYR